MCVCVCVCVRDCVRSVDGTHLSPAKCSTARPNSSRPNRSKRPVPLT